MTVSTERAGAKLLLAKIAGIVVSFVGLAVYSRILNTSDLGAYFVLQSAVGVLSVPADFGVRGAIEKRISEGEDPGEILAAGLAIKTIIIIIATSSIFILSDYINQFVDGLFLYLLLGVILQEGALLSFAVVRGELRVGETAILTFLRNTSWVSFGLIAFSLGSSTQAPIFGWLAGFVVIIVIGIWKINTKLNWPNADAFRSLFDYSIYAVISRISGQLFNWTDILIISYFLTNTSVAAYEVAWRITSTTTVVTTVVMTTIFPYLSERSGAGDDDAIEKLVSRSFLPSLFFVIPSIFGLIAVGEDVLVTFFAPEFAIAGIAIILLMLYRLVDSVNRIVDQSLNAMDRPNLVAIASIIGIIFNVLFNLILIPQYGLIGAAIATGGSYAIKMVLQLLFLSRLIRIGFPFHQVVWCVVAAISMFLVISVSKPLIPTGSMLGLIGLIIGASVVYMAVALAYSPVYESLSRIVDRARHFT
jgi:O-antigen/teichoic acid export membrane protein